MSQFAEGPGYGTNQTYPTDLATERGPADFDARHNLRVVGLYDLPIFRRRTDWEGNILGGREGIFNSTRDSRGLQ